MLRLIPTILFVIGVMAITANALETCSTCEACTAKLAVNNAVVEISSDLASSGDCIAIIGNDTSLDCGSHPLNGNGGSGIVVRSSNVQISNCIVQNYSNAIKLENAIGVILQDSSLLHGQSYGDLLHIRGNLEHHYDHTFSGVTIEGKPLAYAFNQDGVEIGADDDGMVMVAYSDSAKIRNVDLSYGDGVRIHYSSGVTVENVIVTGGKSTGIESYHSPSGTYVANQIQESAKKGIYLVFSPGSTLSGNVFSSNTERSIEISGSSCADYSNTIGVSNTVNGKPVNYYYDATGDVTGLDSGLLSIYCSSGMTIVSSKANGGESIFGFNVTGSVFRGIETNKGLRLLESNGNNISYSTVGGDGITLEGSDNNTVFRNIVSSTAERGIYMVASDNNTVESNTIISAPEEGLVIHESRGNTLLWNNITGSGKGIVARCSQGNVVTMCNSSYNDIGMWMGDCANITVEGNTFQNNQNEGIKIEGAASSQSYIKIWHNNVFANTQCCGGSRQISGEYDLQLHDLHQGNYWGRATIPAFVAGQESNRQGIVDAFPYWKPFGWLFIPVVTEVDISQTTVTAMDSIACRFFVSDQNNATLSVNVTWWKDGTVNSTTTVAVQNGTYTFSNHTAGTHYKNQKWSCSVQPFDGDDWGYMINTSDVSVINSKPTTPSLQLPQQNATLRDQTVTFTYKSIDGDKDNLTYYFYIDNTIINTTQESVVMNLTAGNHNWSVKAFDGLENSTRSEDRLLTLVLDGSSGSGSDGQGSGGGGGSITMTTPERIDMKQNEIRTYSITVKNGGSTDVDLGMRATSNCAGCTFRVDPSIVFIESGKTGIFQITLNVPISEPAGDKTMTVKLYEDGTEKASANIILRVTELPIICANGEIKCDGDRIVTCNPYKTGWVEKQSCPYGCENSKCKSEPQVCSPNSVICEDNKVKTCNSRGNAWLTTQECIFGCEEDKCVTGFDPTLLIIIILITVGAVSGVFSYFYLKAKGKRKKEDREKQWRNLESRYAE